MISLETINTINSAKGLRNTKHTSGNLIKELFETQNDNEASKLIFILWGNMLHQGKVSEVAFFIVPQLVNYMLENQKSEAEIIYYCTCIEYYRISDNLEIPKTIKTDYKNSFEKLWSKINYFLEKKCDFDMCLAVSSLIAIKNNQPKLMSMLILT